MHVVDKALMTDDMVDTFMQWLQRRSARVPQLCAVAALSSVFSQIAADRTQVSMRIELARMLQETPADDLLLPVCAHSHWILLHARRPERIVYAYDPLGANATHLLVVDVLLGLLRSYAALPVEWRDSSWHARNVAKAPRQQDSVSCGVFVCAAAERITRGEPLVFPSDHVSLWIMRQRILLLMMRCHFD